jgi:hypothetical protein
VKYFTNSLRAIRALRILASIVRRMTLTVLLSIPLFALSGCGPRITNANIAVVNKQRDALEKVGKGVSPKEVESILGLPKHAESTKLPLETQKKEVDVVRYFYEQDGETVVLHFVDNKLVSDVLPLGSPPPEKPVK